jgi:hypothetical protein
MKEEVIKEQASILRVSIFRPGMLNRLMGDRMIENIINTLGLGLRVDVLAQAMIRDAESEPPTAKEEVRVFQGNPTITNLAKSRI